MALEKLMALLVLRMQNNAPHTGYINILKLRWE